MAFFRGASLRPMPPGESKQKDVRYLDIREDDKLDESPVRRLGEAGQQVARRADVNGQTAMKKANATMKKSVATEDKAASLPPS